MNDERDASMRVLASRFSEVAQGTPVHESVGAAALFIVCLADQVPPESNEAFRAMCAAKLQQVADLIKPKDPA